MTLAVLLFLILLGGYVFLRCARVLLGLSLIALASALRALAGLPPLARTRPRKAGFQPASRLLTLRQIAR